MWLSYKTVVYKHFPAKFLRRKRNEKLRHKKRRRKKRSNKPFFFVSHQTSSCCTLNKGGQLTAVSKPKANNGIRAQAYHQTSQELFFIVSLTIFGKRKLFLFSFFPFCFFFLTEFFWQFRPKKNHNKKVPETNSWLIKGD